MSEPVHNDGCPERAGACGLPSELGWRIRFVLVEPSHPGNVGATARAMRAMGFRDLVLVNPRYPGVAAHPDAVAFASGANDVLAGCREVASLCDALADTSFAVALSAASREFGPAPVEPEAAVACAFDELDADPVHHVAFVFGCERTGLSIDDVLRCQALASVPTDPSFSSLNLSQAVQIVAWELRRAMLARSRSAAGQTARGGSADAIEVISNAGGADSPLALRSPAARRARRDRGPGAHATQREIEALFEHLERALIDIRFLDPDHPKKLMPRLRRLLSRTRLETEEVELLRGVCTQMSDKARRER